MNFDRRIPLGCWLLGAMILLIIPAAPIAAPLEEEIVQQRSHPELEPLGIEMGNTLIYPRLSYTGQFDDNIFATENNEKSDFISTLSPGVMLRSERGRHLLTLSANADFGRYRDSPSENFGDWGASAESKLEIHHNILLLGNGSFNHRHISRTSPDDIFGTEPTTYDEVNLSGRYSHQLGRFTLATDARFLRKDFTDVPGISGLLNQDDRDRTASSISLRSSYESMPRHQLFVQLRHHRHNYDDLQDVTNFDRSSQGYELMVGATFDRRSIITGELRAGFYKQDYYDPLPDVRTPVFGALIDWNITRLTTINLDLQRSIDETIHASFSSIVSTTATLKASYELRRNLLLNAGVTRMESDYEGIGIVERNDSIYGIRADFTYMINRNLHASAQYDYLQRDSSDNTLAPDRLIDFNKHSLLLRLQTQL